MSQVRREWSDEEDRVLIDAVSQDGGTHQLDWHEIARNTPGRTIMDCRERWQSKLVTNVDLLIWKASEEGALYDAAIERAVDRGMSASKGRTRNAGQCASQFTNTMSPNNDDKPWAPEEDRHLMQLIGRYGTNWTNIVASGFMGRTPASVKHRSEFLSRMNDNARSQLDIAQEHSPSSSDETFGTSPDSRTPDSIISFQIAPEMNSLPNKSASSYGQNCFDFKAAHVQQGGGANSHNTGTGSGSFRPLQSEASFLPASHAHDINMLDRNIQDYGMSNHQRCDRTQQHNSNTQANRTSTFPAPTNNAFSFPQPSTNSLPNQSQDPKLPLTARLQDIESIPSKGNQQIIQTIESDDATRHIIITAVCSGNQLGDLIEAVTELTLSAHVKTSS